jgi:secondary thiamine-phosphate synthase enzyme
MSIYYEEIHFKTKGEVDIIDITSKVQNIIVQSKIQNGIVCIFVNGSTGGITTVEYEPGLQQDIPNALERIAPKNIPYEHHNTWHDDNGHSHVRASLIGPSITMPIKNGELIHGTWQQVVFLELDTSPRKRTVIVEIVGE